MNFLLPHAVWEGDRAGLVSCVQKAACMENQADHCFYLLTLATFPTTLKQITCAILSSEKSPKGQQQETRHAAGPEEVSCHCS